MMKNFLVGVFVSSCLCASPNHPNVVSGTVSIDQSSPSLTNICPSDRAILHWESFSISSDEQVRFTFANDHEAVLNRVMGNFPSEIYGDLFSNGHVFLINPAGILIGENAQILTSAFTASTLDVTNEDFLAGVALQFSGLDSHAVVNLGKIQAANGDITLLARKIENYGVLEASNGSVNMACGSEILLCPYENEKIFIRSKNCLDPEGIGILQKGEIQALQAEIKAEGSPYSTAIQCDGKIDALGLEEKGGTIYLVAEDGKLDLSGDLTAMKPDSGGEIRLLGEEVSLLGSSVVDVSHDQSGGTVLIGGDYRGQNPEIQNAKSSSIGKDVKIYADALVSGDGGKVILWSDQQTKFYGAISVQGGAQSGNGGFIEVSSPGILIPQGKVDARAPFGKNGMYYLDPSDINIVTGAMGASSPAFTNPYNPAVATATLTSGDLLNALGSASVTIETSAGSGGSGLVSIQTTLDTVGGWGVGNDLTINASSIEIQSQALVQAAFGGSLTLTATGDITIGDGTQTINQRVTSTNTNVTSTGGNVTVTGNSSFTTYFLGFQNGGKVSASGDISMTRVSSDGPGGGRDVELFNAGGSITLDFFDMFVGAGRFAFVAGTDISWKLTGTVFGCGGAGFDFTAGRDIVLTNGEYQDSLAVPVNMTAGRNVTFSGFNLHYSNATTTIITDNDFSSAPNIGPGGFSMDASAAITNSTLLRIFTAKRSQNTIAGTNNLNGQTFTPGTYNVDTATEQWMTYAPSTFGGTPYTIFYKEPQPVAEEAAIAASEALIINENYIFPLNAEMLKDLHPFSEFISTSLNFQLNIQNELQDFFIRRRYFNDDSIRIRD